MITVEITNDGIKIKHPVDKVAICMYCKFVTNEINIMFDHLTTKQHIKNKKKYPERLHDKKIYKELGEKYDF